MQKNILITGKPKSGKSTLLATLIADISNKVGFLTNEILPENNRVGFEIQTNTGHKVLLAHTDFETPYQVSKYFVDIKNLESILPEISSFKSTDILYIDEIGQMQLFLERFKELVLQFLNSTNTCLATLSCIYEDDFIRSIKTRDDIVLIEVTPENREEKKLFIEKLLTKIEKAKKYVSEPERFIKNNSGEVFLASEHATRKLIYQNGQWECDCQFFSQYNICSHSIATMEFIKS